MPRPRPLNRALVLLAAALLATAPSAVLAKKKPRTPDLTMPPPVFADIFPEQVEQGALVRARTTRGSRVELLDADGKATEVRVGNDGGYVVGVGRDEPGPLRLRIHVPEQVTDGPSGAVMTREVPVTARQWNLEKIEGVPEATVNPPPEIAERIAREQALVAAARTRDDDRNDYEADFDWPVQGRVSGVFGSQRIYNGTPKSPHSGLDVAAAKGTPVHAPAAGIVTLAEPDLYLTGGTVLLDHGHGVSSNFLHFSRIDVTVGQHVEKGQVLGLVGATGRATGPHMHWGMNWFGVRVDPQRLLPAPAKAPAPKAPAPATPSAGAAPSQ
jgi:murein DD-endopeptidase MepM/ murein hydrolase activator NlpD